MTADFVAGIAILEEEGDLAAEAQAPAEAEAGIAILEEEGDLAAEAQAPAEAEAAAPAPAAAAVATAVGNTNRETTLLEGVSPCYFFHNPLVHHTHLQLMKELCEAAI